MFLLDVGVSPVDADERQHALESVGGDRALQKGLAFEGAEHRVAEAEAKLGALPTGKMGEVQDEAEPFHSECLDAFVEEYPPPEDVDVVTEENTTTIEADGMDGGQTAAAGEVLTETVAVATSDEDGAVRGLFLDVWTIDLLEETGLDEAFGQHELGIQVFHVYSPLFGFGRLLSSEVFR